MITRSPNGAASEGGQYYKEGEYYHQSQDGAEGHAPAEWLGAGAEALGLQGEFQAEDFEKFDKLLAGELPTGEKLPTPSDPNKERRSGEDVTLSAPKSVSEAALIGGDERLLVAHDEAVKEAVTIMQAEMFGTRQKIDGVQQHVAAGAIVGAFRHETARPVDGVVDPQIHTHTVWINGALREDGQWRSADWKMEKGDFARLDAIYKARLASKAQDLGYPVRKTKDGFELSGISDKALKPFSARTDQIDKELEKRGLTREGSTDGQRDAANISTRQGKIHQTQEAQHKQWEERAEAANVLTEIRTAVEVARQNSVTPIPPRDPKIHALETAEAIKSAVRHLGEREHVFDCKRLETEALRAGIKDQVTHQDVVKALDNINREKLYAETGLIKAEVKGQEDKEFFTTKAALARDEKMIAQMKSGQNKFEPAMTAERVAETIKNFEREKGFALSTGQRDALVLALSSKDQIVGWQGYAGAGKTTAIEAAAQALKAQCREVIGLAPTGKAAQELAASLAGADVKAQTIAKWEAAGAKGDKNTTIIIDEVGMVSSRDMQKIMDRAEKTGMQVIALGDFRQIQSVEAGSPAKLLQDNGMKTAVIDDIRRQNNQQLKAVVESFAKGDAKEGVEKTAPYIQKVNVADGKTAREAIADAAARDYLSRPDELRRATIVVVATNQTRKLLNEKIRDGLKKDGTIDGEKESAIRTLHKTDFTREQMREAHNYEPGQKIVPMRNYEERGVRFADPERQKAYQGASKASDKKPPAVPMEKGQEYTVKDVDTAKGTVILENKGGDRVEWKPEQASKVRVYNQDQTKVAPGDVIVSRENQQFESVKGEQVQIVNGQKGEVKGQTQDGTIIAEFKDAKGETKEVLIGANEGAKLEHGYSGTVHAAQGATAKEVIGAIESKSELNNANQAYVALSRAKDDAVVYSDDPEKLAEKWQGYNFQKNANEHAHEGDKGRHDPVKEERNLQPIERDETGKYPEPEAIKSERDMEKFREANPHIVAAAKVHAEQKPQQPETAKAVPGKGVEREAPVGAPRNDVKAERQTAAPQAQRQGSQAKGQVRDGKTPAKLSPEHTEKLKDWAQTQRPAQDKAPALGQEPKGPQAPTHDKVPAPAKQHKGHDGGMEREM
ncbi:MobF family relaxase [Acidithiobacillus ferrianus]|uniref:Relaxase domain-containing protein n=2 Tax=Acidithiobacillus ferrianus TaxID=2678518 RepID=A0A845UDD0_9PROT|nr:MobF family relaxase [Acidithiobacillus ferrianus]NDU43355.1 relaxase domain-containing protein [Acidithiobacillus ferrianus]